LLVAPGEEPAVRVRRGRVVEHGDLAAICIFGFSVVGKQVFEQIVAPVAHDLGF